MRNIVAAGAFLAAVALAGPAFAECSGSTMTVKAPTGASTQTAQTTTPGTPATTTPGSGG